MNAYDTAYAVAIDFGWSHERAHDVAVEAWVQSVRGATISRWHGFVVVVDRRLAERVKGKTTFQLADHVAEGLADPRDHVAEIVARDRLRGIGAAPLSRENRALVDALVDGLSIAEISERFGVPRPAVRQRIVRLRKRLEAS